MGNSQNCTNRPRPGWFSTLRGLGAGGEESVDDVPAHAAQAQHSEGVAADYNPPLFNDRMEQLAADSLREAAQQPDPRIAIIGERGVGKSTLINSLRGLRPSDLGAAGVGADEVVSEDQLQGGAFYRDAGLIYQDVPGCRGSTVDVGMDEDYVKRFDLEAVDCCVFVYISVISADLISCARLLRARGVCVCFVRNKLDVDCSNEIEDGNAKSEEEAVAMIRERAYSQMRSKDFSECADADHLFLVSAKYSHAVAMQPPRFDFQLLKEALQNSIRHEAKRAQVKEIFAKNAKALAACRADECRSLVGSYVLASAASGAVPVPGVSQVGDIAILAAACQEFQRIFCLTEGQLDYMSLAGIGTYLGLKLTTSVPAVFATAQAMNWVADGAAFCPIFGVPLSVLLGSSVSAAGMWITLTAIIWRLEQIAAQVYDFVLHETSKVDAEAARTNLQRAIESTFPDDDIARDDLSNQLYT